VPDEKIPHNQAVGRFYGVWSRKHPTIFLKGSTGYGKSPSTMYSDPVEGKRSLLAEYQAASFGGSGQWRVIPAAWTSFAQRHGITMTATELEELVTDSR
ncbi:unnamed protein product, partial [Prorocentrum cordatum]